MSFTKHYHLYLQYYMNSPSPRSGPGDSTADGEGGPTPSSSEELLLESCWKLLWGCLLLFLWSLAMWWPPFCLYLLILPTEKSKGCSSCGAWWCRAAGGCWSSIGIGLFGGLVVFTAFVGQEEAHQWWCWGMLGYHWWPVLLATAFRPPSIVLLLFGFSVLLLLATAAAANPEATTADASSTQRRIASLFKSARVASLLLHYRNKQRGDPTWHPPSNS